MVTYIFTCLEIFAIKKYLLKGYENPIKIAPEKKTLYHLLCRVYINLTIAQWTDTYKKACGKYSTNVKTNKM